MMDGKALVAISNMKNRFCIAKKNQRNKRSGDVGKSEKSKMQVIILSVVGGLLAVTLIILTVLTIINSLSAGKAADKFVEACRSGDSFAMEQFLPGTYEGLPEDIEELLTDEELRLITGVGEEESQDDGHALQKLILIHSEIKRSATFTLDDEVTLKLNIEGPDMKKIFDKVNSAYLTDSEDAPEIDADSLYEETVSQIESGKYTYRHTVEIPMTKSGGQWHIRFNAPEITDELTGGLQTAYSELYKRALDELMEYYELTDKEELPDEK